jgi:hypothetical protein
MAIAPTCAVCGKRIDANRGDLHINSKITKEHKQRMPSASSGPPVKAKGQEFCVSANVIV